jgi:AAA family ATP:ADP antiporter
MERLTSRFLDVRPGEGGRALQAALAIFLLIGAHTMLETARDTLFLQRLAPSSLTSVYALIAALTFAVTPLAAALARRFGRRNALVATLLVAAYGTAIFYMQAPTPASVFALYAWSGLLGTLLVLQFWLFAGELLTVTQGKRLFGPIAAGGALGAVVGASTSVALLAMLSIGSVLLTVAAVFVVTALLLTSIDSEQLSPRQAAARKEPGAREALALARGEPYVLRLVGLSVLGAAALLTTDYLFKMTAARSVPAAELGAFFGSYYAVLNASSLLLQLFFAGPLIRRVGVVPALAVLPALLFVGGALTVLAGASLWLVMALKSSDGALRHSVHRVANEVVQMPLSAAVHERVKAFVDGPLPRVAQATTAGALMFVTSMDPSTERWLAALAAVFSAGWLLMAIGLKKPYLERFREALARPISDRHPLVRELDVDSAEAVLQALSSLDPRRVIGAMELLADKNRVGLIPALILRHEDETVLVRALDILADSARDDWLQYCERLLNHASEAVRAAALRALSGRGRHDALERGLLDSSPAVTAQAAFWLVSIDSVKDPLSDRRIASLFELEESQAVVAQKALLGAIQDAPHARWIELLLAVSKTRDALLFEQVALAMAKIKDERFVPILIPRLDIRDGRGSVREALVAQGEPALDALERALHAPATPESVRVHVPRTISRFLSQRAADILVEQLDNQRLPGLVRYKVLRGLGRLVAETRVKVDRARIDAQIRHNLIEQVRVLAIRIALGSGPIERGERSRRLVLELLDAKHQQSLERAFRLLGIRHKNEDIRGVFFALNARERRTRAHALEFLDVLTTTHASDTVGREVRELFLIAADDLTPAERVARSGRFLPTRPTTHAEALTSLIADEDESLAAFAAYHALEYGSSELEQEVATALSRRPGLNRGTGSESLFPPPLEVRHAT